MPDFDQYDDESRFDCAACQETGIDIESREYCSCELGKRRKNLDRLAEPLRHHPFTDAMWIAHHSAMKSERAIAAADKALLVVRAQRAEAAKLNAEGRAFEMSRKLEQGQQWISVDERLPGEETDVIALRNGNPCIAAIFVEIESYEEGGRRIRYWDDPNDDGQGWGFDEITHWMPLPAAPSIAQDGQKSEGA